MSQFRTPARIRLFEAASLLVMALTALWFAGLALFLEARRHGLL